MAAAQPLFLDVLPVELRPGVELDVKKPLRVAAYTSRPQSMAALWASSLPVRVLSDHVLIDLVDYPILAAPVTQEQLRPSFLIDYEEAPVRAFVERVRPDLARAPFTRWARAVDEEIDRKTHARGFDPASTVARRREGDCTEHAVLLTALARALGRPARVVMGVALVVGTDNVAAYGHAWTEIHDGDTWRRVDATRIHKQVRQRGLRLRYLPILIIEDEGPGYEFKYVGALQSKWLDRLEIMQVE